MMATGVTKTAIGSRIDRRHDEWQGAAHDSKRQQGNRWHHDDGNGRHNDGNGWHDDGKGQQGIRRHNDGDGQHNDGNGRNNDSDG